MNSIQLPLLILDLDETLVFATEKPLDTPADFVCTEYFVYRRPHLTSFLNSVYDKFRVAIWTSSGPEYAEGIAENIFESRPLEFLWARDRCTQRYNPESAERYWVKDLKKVKRRGYRLEQTIMVDDTPKKLTRNYGNYVRIEEFSGDPNDEELKHLSVYLAELAQLSDVRAVEKRGWRKRDPSRRT